jgi:phenylacetic acid degradation protein
MSMFLYEFNGKRPQIHTSAYLHESAVVIGDVSIGAGCYIGPNATLRGDNGNILLMDFCNVQDGCVVHVSPGGSAILQTFSQMGHGAIVHGATICYNTIIGINSTVLDLAVVSDGCVVAANSLIKIKEFTKPASLYAGTPAMWIKDLTQDTIEKNLNAARKYVAFAQTYPILQRQISRSSCEPDSESIAN